MLSKTEGIITMSGMKSTCFPVSEPDVLEKLLTYELLEKLLSGEYEKTNIEYIIKKVKFYQANYKLVRCSLSDN
jgi:hypothetical protein